MSNKRAVIFLSKILFSSALETSASAKQWWFFLFLRLCRPQLLDDIEYGVGGEGGFELGVSGIKELSLDAFEIEYDLKYRSVIL